MKDVEGLWDHIQLQIGYRGLSGTVLTPNAMLLFESLGGV